MSGPTMASSPPPGLVPMNSDDRVLITGCGGMLGDAVYETFSGRYRHVYATDIALSEPWLTPLDVREMGDCERAFAAVRPTIVLHLAALTDLEYCETHRDDCWKTNALGAENVALLARQYDATMVYISTAGIYAGDKDEYHDFDLPNPLSHYGRAKYHGERFVETRVPRYFCLRAGWMMGGGPKKDKKFINKIFQQIRSGSRQLRVVDDRFGTPTYTVDFARSAAFLLGTQYYGVYNHVCEGGGSRYDVAVEFVRLLGLADAIKVTKVGSDYYRDAYFAPRPSSERLVNLKLNARGLNRMRDWRTCLEEYAAVYKRELDAEV
jgi:dTDP-4-dehydrorhamnose reductase